MRERAADLGSAFGAVAGSVASAAAALCCVGPLALTLLGVNGMILAAGIKPYRGYLLAGSFLLLALAFGVMHRRSSSADAACSTRSARITRIILWGSVSLWIVALLLNIASDFQWL
jgi:hypothetical protein